VAIAVHPDGGGAYAVGKKDLGPTAACCGPRAWWWTGAGRARSRSPDRGRRGCVDAGAEETDGSVHVDRQGDVDVRDGNHFAAWQEPALFTTGVRAAFGSVR